MIVSVLAALTIFPVVFTFDIPPEAGYGLIFETLPFLFAKLPAGMVLSTLFFSLFVFTALTSAIPLVEVVATNLMELFKLTRKRAVIYVGVGCFLFGIPSAFASTGLFFPDWKEIYGMNFLETMNTFVSTWIIPIGGLMSAIFVGWYMDKKVCKDELLQGTKSKWIWKPWLFFMRYLVPLTVIIIVIQKSGLFDFDVLMRGSHGGG